MSLQTYWCLLLFSHTHTHCCLSLYYLVKSGFGLLSLLWRAVCLIFLMSASSCVVCVLTAAERRRRLLRGLRGPLLGGTWTRTVPLVTLPNVSIDGRETCWIAVPNKAGAKTKSGLAGWGWGSFCWQTSSLPCRGDSLMAVRAELI